MRKISELLDISKKHHELWGGVAIGMCHSAAEAMEQGEITIGEWDEVGDHCMMLVEEIDPDATYLFEALCFDRTHESDRRQLKDWWEDHISSLKSEGL